MQVDPERFLERVAFDEAYYNEIRRRGRRRRASAGSRFATNRCFRPTEQNAILEFLGVETTAAGLKIGSVKQNSSDLKDLVENYDQLLRVFAGTPFEAELLDCERLNAVRLGAVCDRPVGVRTNLEEALTWRRTDLPYSQDPARSNCAASRWASSARGEALVQIRACGLCTMEQRLWQGTQDDYPIAAGHETAGVVAAVHPEGVVGISVGQRVAIAFLDRCMQCEACRRGDSNLCTGKLQSASRSVLRRIGGLADYAIVPAWKLFADARAICRSTRLPCASRWPAWSIASKWPTCGFGDDVLVIGCGTMGYLHLALARLREARVLVSDPDPDRRRLALRARSQCRFRAGRAAQQVRHATRGQGADAVFVTFGSQETAGRGRRQRAPGGRVIYYGSFPAGVDPGVDARRMHHQEIALMGSRGQTLEDWQQASRLVAERLVDLRPLISARYPLAKLGAALEPSEPAGSAYRVIVNP